MINSMGNGLDIKSKCVYRAIVFDETKMDKLFEFKGWRLGVNVIYLVNDTMRRMKMKLTDEQLCRVGDAIIWAVINYPNIELA